MNKEDTLIVYIYWIIAGIAIYNHETTLFATFFIYSLLYQGVRYLEEINKQLKDNQQKGE